MCGLARIGRFIIGAALSGLTACGGGIGQQATPSAAAGVAVHTMQSGASRPQSTAQQVYVSDEGAGAVFIYPAGVNNPSPTATITDGIDEPLGIAVGADGTLYVANFHGGLGKGSGNGSVTVYKAGSTHPSLTITDVNEPNSVAVDAHGTLYVGENASNTTEIAEFAPGATSPTKTVTPTGVTGFPFMGGMTIDKKGNLYAASFVYFRPPVRVVRYAAGLMDEHLYHFRGLKLFDLNPGLARDGAGNIYVATLAGVNVYPRHSSEVSRTIEISTPQYIAATNDGTLYVPDQTNVEIYAPGSGTPEASIQNSLVLPEGVAIH
jgi:hypothetical protein